jgi:cytochrome c oxidase subunit 2
VLEWLPEAASSYAVDMDNLIGMINLIVGAWFLLAVLVLVYLTVRYRRREGQRAAYLPATSLRAMSVILVPCALILGFDLVIDAAAARVWDEIKIDMPPHDEIVGIRGDQWVWRFTYPGPDGELGTEDDFESVGELRVPLDKVVLFELTAKDVLHSMWVPELRLKQDAVPGRTIRGWFQPTREGRFEFICAEICGVGHTVMKAALVVEGEEQYKRWLEERMPAAP